VSAKVTIYNDGATDFQVIHINTRSGLKIDHRVMPSGDDDACQQFRLGNDEMLVVTTAETASEKDQCRTSD